MKSSQRRILEIVPTEGVGLFCLNSSINYIISNLRSEGELFEHVEILVGNSFYETKINEAIQINLDSEGIKLYFNSSSQRLELIELNLTKVKRKIPIYYKKHLIVDNDSFTGLSYNYINSLFGPSNMPKLINNEKQLLLRYDGISFIFDNSGVDKEDTVILGSDASLAKVLIYSGKSLHESLLSENIVFPHVKVYIEKLENRGIIISLSEEEVIFVQFGDLIENVQHKLKNSSYVYYKEENNEYFLNYFSLGLDLMFDSITNRVKKIILHCNNPYDSKFGIYTRCNFVLDINKNLFLNKYASKRKESEYSDESPKIEEANNSQCISVTETGKNALVLEHVESTTFGVVQDHGLSYKENYKLNERTRKTSFDKDKSFGSINESNVSFSLNNSDLLLNYSITPSSNFQEILNKFNTNSFTVYHKHDSKLNSIVRYYTSDGLIFEVNDYDSILSVQFLNDYK